MGQPPGSVRTQARREVDAHQSGDDRVCSGDDGTEGPRGLRAEMPAGAWTAGPSRSGPGLYLCAALPILIVLGLAASALGNVSVRTPFSNRAVAWSASTGPGSVTARA